MKLNAASYFAGVGTVVAALAVGFGGALLITGSGPKTESQNRLQQVMSHAPTPSPASSMVGAEKVAAADVPPSSSAQRLPIVQQPSPEPALPIVARQAELPTPPKVQRDQTLEAESVDRAKKRAAEMQHAVERENQRKWIERKRRQEEIDSATMAVRRMLRDNGVRQVVQTDNIEAAHGFFGRDN